MGTVYNSLTAEQKIKVDSLIELPPNKIKSDSRRVDLTDQIFGDWKVVEYAGHKKWICICSCGEIKKVLGVELRAGRSRSCGHGLSKECLIGMTFGYWEVIDKVDSSHYLCRCHCGCPNLTEKSISTFDLVYGKTKSCGYNTTRRESIVGNKYNHWTVLRYIGNGIYECQCDCENHTIGVARRSDLLAGRTKSCGHDTNKLVDLTGKTFGNWKVLRHVGYGKWLCQCLCEAKTEKVLGHTELINGETTSCGCKHSETLRQTMLERYGDPSTSHIGNPRTPEQLQMIDDADSLKSAIQSNFDHKPTIYELESLLGCKYTYIIKLIHKFNLEDCMTIYNNYSHYEDEICSYIESLGITDIIRGDRKVLSGQELDILIPSKQFAVEFNGVYWHSSIYKDKYYHQNKSILGFQKRIHILHIFEHEWLDPRKQKILKGILRNNLSNNKTILYARNCTVKHIDNKTCTEFLDKTHLQGAVTSEIRLGLFDKSSNLMGVMTFGRPRFSSEYEYELIRLAWLPDVNVVGGSEKLFKAFIKEYNPSSIMSYCDIGKFSGNVYLKLGFKPADSKEFITSPNYNWVDLSATKVVSRYKAQKHKLIEAGLGTELDTESEIMESLGYLKVYDSGNAKFVWKADKSDKSIVNKESLNESN